MAGVRDRRDVVHEAALAPEKCLVLEARERSSDPRPVESLLLSDRYGHRANLHWPRAAQRRAPGPARIGSSGHVSPEDALDRFASLPASDLVFARVDAHREVRQGAPEAVLAEGKTPGQVTAIVEALLEAGAGSVLVTRADPEVRAAVKSVASDAEEDGLARAVWSLGRRRSLAAWWRWSRPGPPTARCSTRRGFAPSLLGAGVSVHEDVGVAGLHRLAPVLPDLGRADCVVVVAGMDAALRAWSGD